MEDSTLQQPVSKPSPRQRLATHLGLELSYENIWGQKCEVPPPTAAAIVEALLGEKLDLDNAPAVEDYFMQQDAGPGQPAGLPGTIVEFVDQPLELLKQYLSPSEATQTAQLWIEWENLSSTRCPLNSASLATLATPGYHFLTIETHARKTRLRWILAPRRCFLPASDSPLNGINCFLPSLRSTRNWGAGDLTDLAQFASQLSRAATFDFIALNPLHAIHNRTPYNTSPYLPLSIFTRNLLYLDIEAIPEFKNSHWAQRISSTKGFQRHIESLRNSEFVEYERVAQTKLFFLRLLHRQYLRGDTLELANYRARRGPWLANFCTYMAFDRHFHRQDPNLWYWRQWPQPFQSPNSAESKQLADRLSTAIDFYAYVEMRLEQQLESAHNHLLKSNYRLGLYQDLALATDRVGADYWAYQDLFAPGVRVGSPPDDFNENGQDWGFPALHPRRHADSGYSYFVESIRCASRHAGAIRFDHVMRLARLYWIPDNMSARNGAYVRDNFQDLLKILALESQRANVVVVGEDLGTVPDYFRKALDDCGILSYRLILFERSGAEFKSPAIYPGQAIASFTTHDLATFDGWLHGADLEARLSTGQLSAADLEASRSSRSDAINALRKAFKLDPQEASPDRFFEGLSTFLAATPACLRLLNLEELTGEREQQNMPGTTSEAPNWRRRLHLPIEQLFEDPIFAGRLRAWSRAQQNGASI